MLTDYRSRDLISDDELREAQAKVYRDAGIAPPS
jgi:hypothetical protein